MRIAAGFMAAKHLFAASELGIFEALGDAPATLEALAARTGLTRRSTRISADAMVALGLLERDDDHYRNSPAATAYLAGGDSDLRPLLTFWDQISYPSWCTLTQALTTGVVREIVLEDAEHQRIACAGIEAVLAGPAHALTEMLDGHHRLLDIGGGTGSWSIAAVNRHPQLEATVVDLPVVTEFARKRIAEAGCADRIQVVAANALEDPLPGDHDVLLVANVIHYYSPETNLELLRRIRKAAPPNARLLLADFWTDPTHTQPLHAALMAGEFAVHVREGDVYSVDEVAGWLGETGWDFQGHQPLVGPQSLITATARG
ncbi:SAM-dependent methyltransferase [Lentzea sp. NBRC 105346]|nr:SAM-dependent methyltransferase [Lentzea sp. NBRC 105346]